MIYIGTDLTAGMLWKGYSFVSQYVSELSALGAPTRTLVIPPFTAYGVLSVLFALGVWRLADENHSTRFLGASLLGIGILNLLAYFFPMHLRGIKASFTDTMHATLAALTVLLILLAVGFGAIAFGTQFRLYSLGTVIILILPSVISFLYAPNISENTSTPWVGLSERITIYGWMLWVAVLSIVLLRTRFSIYENRN